MLSTVIRASVISILLFQNTAFATSQAMVQVNPNFAPVSEEQVNAIAVDAYLYAYPLVLMDISKRVMTNFSQPSQDGAPINQFSNKKTFPDASFTDVVSPNADTLYSFLWYDVSQEPLIIEFPATHGRYYLMPILDMWTDVFFSAGSRTTGNEKQVFALASMDWQGQIPTGANLVHCPTNVGWLLGRYESSGTDDFPAVWELQKQLIARPLSLYGTDTPLPTAITDPNLDRSAPVQQVAKLSGEEFFEMFSLITANNQPHQNDYPILEQMSRIGINPGKAPDLTDPIIAKAIAAAPAIAQKQIIDNLENVGTNYNGWRVNVSSIGTYGTAYLQRATVAYKGLGANVPEDAVYPLTMVDMNNKLFNSAKKYTLHFTKEQIPPVSGFWSLTMYNDKSFFAANPINRFAIGNRDALQYNKDGSLDLYIQKQSPGKYKESNWLPTPESGGFYLALRLYWPKESVLNGTWIPAGVRLSK